MPNEDKTLWLIYPREIYFYKKSFVTLAPGENPIKLTFDFSYLK
jgi:hypothetical protein